jgi:hypothetical protein
METIGKWASSVLLGLMGFSTIAMSASIPIAFTTSQVSVYGPATPEFLEAQNAFESRYSIEDGFVRTQPSANSTLVVVMIAPRFINRLWNKMIRSGTAVSTGRGGEFLFDSINDPAPVPYAWMRSVYADEGTSAYIAASDTRREVVGFTVRLHKACTVSSSKIDKADINSTVRPTALLKTTRQGDNVFYTYAVNGGAGIAIRGVWVNLAPSRTFILVNNCQIDVGLNYAP